MTIHPYRLIQVLSQTVQIQMRRRITRNKSLCYWFLTETPIHNKFRDGWVHVRNSGVKGLMYSLSSICILDIHTCWRTATMLMHMLVTIVVRVFPLLGIHIIIIGSKSEENNQFAICEQWWIRLAWTSAQSFQKFSVYRLISLSMHWRFKLRWFRS